MTVEEAIAKCEFWTPNVAETQMFGSSTDPEVAAVFNCTVKWPRQLWTDPNGLQNYDIRVRRYVTDTDKATGELLKDEAGEYVMVTNPTYTLIEQEIDLRKKAAA